MKKPKNPSTFPESGLVRLSAILTPGPVPVSRSTWCAWVKAGKVSQPQKLGPRISAWPVEEVRRLIEGADND
jgi:predicted DNA-binding transcriptional regulator AlpA